MNAPKTDHFDESAPLWDAEPRRVELAKAVGRAILRHAKPTPDMSVLDYGCGTGLLGLCLLPHVRDVTGADRSPGMLRVLDDKIRAGGLRQMRTVRLDLQRDPPPESRFHLIVANMVLHHVENLDSLLAGFQRMLLPGGMVALADLDAEPGSFHGPDAQEHVFHRGFDRRELADRLRKAGFAELADTTAHVIRKPTADGQTRDFPVFLAFGRRA